MWSRIVDAATTIAARHDETWMKRRRTLNTLIVMLFVFRLVLSRGQKGYATVIAELWDQCRRLGVTLPQPQPVAISSIAKARARVHEDVFRDLQREILAHDTHNPNWNGHPDLRRGRLQAQPAATARGGRIRSPRSRYMVSAGPAVLSLPPRQPDAGRLHPHLQRR